MNDGVLWINRWRFNGDLETLKILSSCLKSLEYLNIQNAERHIVIIAENRPVTVWTQALFLFKKTPFSEQELKDIDGLRKTMGLIWLHDPRERLNTVFTDFLYAQSKENFMAAYPACAFSPTRTTARFSLIT